MTSWKEGLDLEGIKTVPFREIRRKVSVDGFARPVGPDADFSSILSSLPSLLAAADFRDLLSRIHGAKKGGRPIVAMIGAHVIKCGLSPVLIDLLRRGYLTALAMNGAGAIHDFEIALFGETSEDVAEGLAAGTFGMSEETGRLMNEVIRSAAERGAGFGEAVGEAIVERDCPFSGYSLLAAAVEMGVPATVHVAIGTDVIHQHPGCDGAATGSTSHRDFKRFCGVISDLEGGVILNLGSAVMLPEVFLKALCVARNLGHRVENFTSADFDMIRHYRPAKNVVERPTSGAGTGFSFTGHHEIMIPLLAAGLVAGPLDKVRERG